MSGIGTPKDTRSFGPVLALMACSLATGCSSKPDKSFNVDENLVVDENLTTDDFASANETGSAKPLEAKPTHLYSFRDGDKYGYIAAVSEEDQKRGKAAGDVVLFVYRGRDGNTYKIDGVTASGAVNIDYECARPCAAIKRYTYRGVDYLGFEPTSLIGAAFTDAFNGFLTASPLPKLDTSSVEASTYYRTDSSSGVGRSDSSVDPDSPEWVPPASDPIINNETNR